MKLTNTLDQSLIVVGKTGHYVVDLLSLSLWRDGIVSQNNCVEGLRGGC